MAGLPILYFGALRPRLLGWGASNQERRRALPGDDLVVARWQTTRGIDIAAPAGDVWPWLVQMGYGRGGWYSYDWLERRVGAGEFAEGGSAKRLIPELQRLAVGDTVALSPAGGLTVAVLDPGNALVLQYRMNLLTAAPANEADAAVLDWSWAFVLTAVDDASCRLLVRVRADLASLKPVELVFCFLDRHPSLLEFALCLRPAPSDLPLLSCRRCQLPLPGSTREAAKAPASGTPSSRLMPVVPSLRR